MKKQEILIGININENICWESVGYRINSSYIHGIIINNK